MKPLRVAVTDDSAFIRKVLQRILEQETDLVFVGGAGSGEELLANLDAWQPDVITLDLSMPGMGGLAALDRIMAAHPVPVIILSSHSGQDAPLTLEALSRGAVDFVDKEQYSRVDLSGLRAALVEKVRNVARSHPVARLEAVPPSREPRPAVLHPVPATAYHVVVLGASTGGPPAIQQVLQTMEGPLPVPFAVVQHMPPGFTHAFAERLNACLPFPVREATHLEPLVSGRVYLAPSGAHLTFKRERGSVLALLSAHPAKVQHRPSVDELFASAASVFGSAAVAVLLTGMGADGAEGMRKLRQAGALTLAQDEATCVVHGMPRAAVLAGAVQEELPLPAVGPRLAELFRRKTG